MSAHRAPEGLVGLRERATRGILWSATDLLVNHVMQLVIFVSLARLLAPEEFGLIAMAAAVIAFAQIFLEQGFPDAIVQMRDLEREHLDTAFWVNVAAGLVLMASAFAVAGPVSDAYGTLELVPVLQMLSPVFLFGSLSSVQRAILRRQLDFKALTIRNFVAVLSGGAVGITMALLGFGVFSLVAQTLTAAAVGVLVLWWASNWRPGFRFSPAHLRDLTAYGLNIVGANLAGVLTKHGDKALIGMFLGATVLGYYFMAYRAVDIACKVLSGVMNSVAFPVFSRVQTEPAALVRAFYKTVKTNASVAFPAFMGIALLADEVVLTFLGPQWIESIPILRVFSFLGLTYTVSVLNNSLLKSRAKPHWVLALAVAAGLLSALLIVIFVRWGVVAVAGAYVLRSYLLFPLSLSLVASLLRFDLADYIRLYRGAALSTLAMAAVVVSGRLILASHVSAGAFLSIAVAAAVTCYLLTLWLLEPSYVRESIKTFRASIGVRREPRRGVT